MLLCCVAQAVRSWDHTAQWEAQQQQQALNRYQAKVLEQRLARQQVGGSSRVWVLLWSHSTQPGPGPPGSSITGRKGKHQSQFQMFFFEIKMIWGGGIELHCHGL